MKFNFLHRHKFIAIRIYPFQEYYKIYFQCKCGQKKNQKIDRYL